MTDARDCDPSCALLKRREFLGVAALAALTLLEAACGDGQIGPAGPGGSGGGALVVTLANYAALAGTGGVARVDGGSGSPVALVRTGASTFVALSLVCPHQGFTIGVNGTSFLCPAHGARFSGTGTWTGGQPTRNMVTIPSTYDAVAGTVTINR